MKNKLKPISVGSKGIHYTTLPRKQHIQIKSKNMILKNDFKSAE